MAAAFNTSNRSVPPGSVKKVALVGHCGPDSSYLRMVVSKAGRDIQVLSADDSDELKRLLDGGVDLLLLNRQLDYGFDEQEGVELIRTLRAKYPSVKLMLVSNFPEAQTAAVQAGALPGFGKREMTTPPCPRSFARHWARAWMSRRPRRSPLQIRDVEWRDALATCQRESSRRVGRFARPQVTRPGMPGIDHPTD